MRKNPFQIQSELFKTIRLRSREEILNNSERSRDGQFKLLQDFRAKIQFNVHFDNPIQGSKTGEIRLTWWAKATSASTKNAARSSGVMSGASGIC